MTTDIVVGVRWDPVTQQEMDEFEYDGGNSSSRLFERSRIRVLAGKILFYTNYIKFLCHTNYLNHVNEGFRQYFLNLCMYFIICDDIF